MDGVMDMAQTVRLDGDQVDLIVELVNERKEKLLSGKITDFSRPVVDAVSDLDSVLYALGEDDE